MTAARTWELWDKPPFGLVEDGRFHLMTGAQAHEVAVGPVHAGVIEPGHFRFQCFGENVHELEISLGYQARGRERQIVEAPNDARRLFLAQTVAGDTSVAAGLACASALGFGPVGFGPRGLASGRKPGDGPTSTTTSTSTTTTLYRLLLELERIANHVGDLGALAGDVAYLPTASFCGRIRGEYLNMTAWITGNRFGRMLTPPSPGSIDFGMLAAWFAKTERECFHALDLLFSETSAIERFEGTGTVSEEDARAIGMVGVAARASGVTGTAGDWPVVGGGDVLARARQRYEELRVSHRRAAECLERLRSGRDGESAGELVKVEELETEKGLLRVATVDAWRGELTHAALFGQVGFGPVGFGPVGFGPRGLASGRKPGEDSTTTTTSTTISDFNLIEYRVFDPSYFNWFGLSLALRGEQISNFPICNKSFNLSYCGVDR